MTPGQRPPEYFKPLDDNQTQQSLTTEETPKYRKPIVALRH